MVYKHYLELSEAQVIHLKQAVRNELIACINERKEIIKELGYIEAFKINDKCYESELKQDLEELHHTIKKLQQIKAKLYDIL